MSRRSREARWFFDIHLGFLHLFFARHLDEWLDEGRHLSIFGKFLQVLLGEIGPGHALVITFAKFDLHAFIVGGCGKDFASEGFAIIQLEGVGSSCNGEQLKEAYAEDKQDSAHFENLHNKESPEKKEIPT